MKSAHVLMYLCDDKEKGWGAIGAPPSHL